MIKKKAGIIFALLAALFAVILSLSFGGNKIAASANEEFSFNLTKYDVVYDIQSDCSMDVTETITINYSGYANTGFMRDIPIDGDVKVQNLTVNEIIGGEETDVAYDVYFYTDYYGYKYITADIGDSTRKNGEYTYVLRYTYIVPEQENILSLNVIGTGWDCTIENVTVTMYLPDGVVESNSKYYVGTYGSSQPNSVKIDNNTIIISCDVLEAYNGITVDLYFESGVLSSHMSFAPWIAVIAGIILLGLLIVLKMLVFKDPPLTPVVNFTPPDGMDPLNVGQLIDGTINDEDVTSLIFYWADKGYLKINMENEKDPVLIRVYKNLPNSAPPYQVDMFNSLFASGESVKISSLSQRFYPVIERVKQNSKIKKNAMYDGRSLAASTLFAVIGGLLAALSPIILSMATISSKMFDATYFLAIIPAVLVNVLTQAVYIRRYKDKKIKSILMTAGIVILGGVLIAVYTFIVPNMVFETAPCVITGIIALIISMVAATFILRTKLYNEQLNGIIGFKNFILYAEKDRLEALLEDDPQLYYHILPYAQVMGITDKWEDKFKSLTVPAPKWMIDPLGTYVDFVIINRCLRVSFMSMNRNMVARPPSQGGGGGHGFGGGFSGGFGGGVGGGFGGGGGRGR